MREIALVLLFFLIVLFSTAVFFVTDGLAERFPNGLPDNSVRRVLRMLGIHLLAWLNLYLILCAGRIMHILWALVTGAAV